MSTHVEGGRTLCIHSVVVAEPYRRRGIAAWAVRQYLRHVAATEPHVATAVLLSKEGNTGVYARAGFVSRGASSVTHGKDVWMEMARPVAAAAPHGGARCEVVAAPPAAPRLVLRVPATTSAHVDGVLAVQHADGTWAVLGGSSQNAGSDELATDDDSVLQAVARVLWDDDWLPAAQDAVTFNSRTGRRQLRRPESDGDRHTNVQS